LPIDIWRVIINHLTLNEKPEVQYIKLAFIASVSKQINSICKKHKQNIGIQSTVVRPTEFQRYFAVNGYLNSMVYAHENGCQWDRNTCSSAAENGHLECLKYAHENGCKWDEYTCSICSIEWLFRVSFRMSKIFSSYMRMAVNGIVTNAAALWQQICSWDVI
jgi:hypothetical protein